MYMGLFVHLVIISNILLLLLLVRIVLMISVLFYLHSEKYDSLLMNMENVFTFSYFCWMHDRQYSMYHKGTLIPVRKRIQAMKHQINIITENILHIIERFSTRDNVVFTP